ncbi:MAG: D-hydantoinase [Candidatus Heimdallarchaeota archaeon AB_125]|nr:MAG: D-hydantoinase [Candidatus Heimdallarchaeota archaeon AB_125]
MKDNFKYELGLINGKVYQDGNFVAVDVYVKDQVIAEIVPQGTILPCKEIFSCTNKLILPGFIDSHVHINLELGEFKSADDYESASKAAAFGGITTFIDFLEPINKIEEFDYKLKKKQDEAKKSYIDYAFHTTVGNFDDDVEELIRISQENGIPTIKLFTTYSESNRKISDDKLREFLKNSNKTNTLILAHVENDEMILNANVEDTITAYESSRPAKAEIVEIEKITGMAAASGGKLYIVHVTCGSSVELVKDKYGELLGKSIFIESCPQYFHLTKDVFQQENGNLFLLAPPLRSSEEQEKLKENISFINTIGTDHCPFTKEEKMRYKEASKIPKGLGSLEFSFSLMYHLFGKEIIDKFTINPAKIHELFPKKGVIQVSSDADFVIFDSSKTLFIDSGHSRSDYSPYENMITNGLIESVILRGEFVVRNRKLQDVKRGMFIKRN